MMPLKSKSLCGSVAQMLAYRLEVKGPIPAATMIFSCWINDPCSSFICWSQGGSSVAGAHNILYSMPLVGIFPSKWPQQTWEEFQVISPSIKRTHQNPVQTHIFPAGPMKQVAIAEICEFLAATGGEIQDCSQKLGEGTYVRELHPLPANCRSWCSPSAGKKKIPLYAAAGVVPSAASRSLTRAEHKRNTAIRKSCTSAGRLRALGSLREGI